MNSERRIGQIQAQSRKGAKMTECSEGNLTAGFAFRGLAASLASAALPPLGLCFLLSHFLLLCFLLSHFLLLWPSALSFPPSRFHLLTF
jgi:hypothetical protein